ncbi:MAG: hypothetical protein ACI311_05625 [Bacilli bacterium]
MKLTLVNEEFYIKNINSIKDFKIDCIYNDLLMNNLNSLYYEEDDYPHFLKLTYFQMENKIYQNIQDDIDFCCVLKDEYIKDILEFIKQFDNVEVTIFK